MKKVRIFYAGIPAKNTNLEKARVLDNFFLGVRDKTDAKQILTPNWEPCDLAVMQGWVHKNSGKTPHLMFRKEIIDRQKSIGAQTLAIDSNLFLYKDPTNKKTYLRFSLNDVFPITGNYFTDEIDPSRWQQIKNDIGIDVKPWRETGNHILICLQRNGGWSMGGLDVMLWLHQTIKRIRQYSDRLIVVRGHPGDKSTKNYLHLNIPNVTISKNSSISSDLQNAWATITYNSSPGVASAIEGVPIFVTDPNPKISQAYDVCNTDLSLIENPILHSDNTRQQWLEKISMSHFNFADLATGKAWEIIGKYV